MTSSPRLLVPTYSVLLTNVMSGQSIPKGTKVHLRTDLGDLSLLATTSPADLLGFPIYGCDENGGTFTLLPEQIALSMTIARGPLASTLINTDSAPVAGKKRQKVTQGDNTPWYTPPSGALEWRDRLTVNDMKYEVCPECPT